MSHADSLYTFYKMLFCFHQVFFFASECVWKEEGMFGRKLKEPEDEVNLWFMMNEWSTFKVSLSLDFRRGFCANSVGRTESRVSLSFPLLMQSPSRVQCFFAVGSGCCVCCVCCVRLCVCHVCVCCLRKRFRSFSYSLSRHRHQQ